MKQNIHNKNSLFSQIDLTKIVVYSAIVLAFFLTTIGVSTALAIDAPTPLTPAYGTIGTVVNFPPLGIPTFTWTAEEGATKYKIQISNDIGFTGPNTREYQTDNTFYVPPNLGNLVNNSADGVWYWRVRVEASPEGASSYSQTMMFEKRWSDNNAPVLSSPSDGANIDFYNEVTFSWNHVIGAAKYRFQIATSDDGFGSPIYNITTLNIHHQPLTRWANGTYYWRVLPLDAADVAGTPSEVRVFYQNYNNIPGLISPVDNSEPIFTPTFRWTAVEGARKYRLAYSTSNDFTTGTTTILTPNTSYTPQNALANNQNIYWRVRVESGNSITDWSTVYSFVKKWVIQPQLLTPPNGFQHENHPLFSWVPVPGASYYKIEIARNSTFTDGRREGTTSNPFYTPNGYEGADYSWYWRVTPYDKNNNQGQTSTTFSYNGYYKNLAPDQVYPLYYYEPNNYPYPADNVTMNQYEDHTVPLPLFVWLRTHTPFDETDPGDAYPDAYRLQVATDQNFSSVVWTVDTENTNAVPLNTSEFNPNASTTYYWRVCPLVGGTCSTDGSARTYWSQVWKTRIDLSQGLDPVANTPVLLQPAHGSEQAELTPWFEWQSVTNATSYEIQISMDSGFSTFDTATTEYPIYSPTDALAQRSLNILDFRTYYWRVRAIFGSTPGGWSDTRRFQVAAQSQWTVDRSTIGTELLEIGTDSSGDIGTAAYDVTKLYAAQDQSFWYFGFDVPTYSGTNVNYALYLDTNHYDGTGWLGDPGGPGGTSDPSVYGYNVSAIDAHRPEFVIYVKQIGGVYNASEVYLYSWNGSAWSDYTLLSNLGDSSITLNSNYLEIKVLNTAIGDIVVDGSYAVSLMSFSTSAGSQPQDSVPSDPNIPGSSQVSRFSSVTEKMTLTAPFNNLGGANHTYSSVQPYFWNWSARAPWAGEIVEVSLDQEFTAITKEYRQDSNTSFWGSPFQFSNNDIGGDDTYYWRVQPLYTPAHHPGVWSEPFRFERVGFIPQNLQTSVTFATPTFSWDISEGAHQYQLEIDNDPNFGSPAIRIDTAQTSYTPVITLANGTYYWRVRVERWGNIDNDWSPTESFTLSLPTPSNLQHTPNPVPDRAPTLCWDHILEDDDGYPVLAAWKYRLLISIDPGFSTTVDNITTEQPCFTPAKGYADGDYYWRVAMIDGDGKLGAYSPTAVFTKQYPVATLIGPTGLVTQTPMFEWTSVDGAASYRIEISKYDTFAPLYDSTTLNNARFTPTKVYDDSTTYYWRVAMIDKENKFGPFTGEEIIIDEGGAGYKIYLPILVR